jgi:hypothetical protein
MAHSMSPNCKALKTAIFFISFCGNIILILL